MVCDGWYCVVIVGRGGDCCVFGGCGGGYCCDCGVCDGVGVVV